MPVHDPTAVEVGLVEMHDAVFRGGRDVHEGFLVGDLVVGAEALAAEVVGCLEFGGELLEAGFAEGGEGGVVVEGGFEGGEEGVFVFGG